jgi:hypothetical protein
LSRRDETRASCETLKRNFSSKSQFTIFGNAKIFYENFIPKVTGLEPIVNSIKNCRFAV